MVTRSSAAIPRNRRNKPVDINTADQHEERTVVAEGEVLDPEMPPQMANFERIRMIPPAEWAHYRAFLYRLEPRVRNAGSSKYIEMFEGPFDESVVKLHHGGGKYQCLLKNTDTNSLEMKFNFDIEGTAKILHSQIVVDDAGNPIPTAPAAPPSAINDATMADVMRQLVSALDNKKVPAEDAIRSAMETLGQAQKGAMELVLNAAKAQAGSQTGNAIMDQVFAEFLKTLTADRTRHANPMSDLKEMLVTMKELRNLTGVPEHDAAPAKASFLDEARGFAELLKADTDGTLRGVLFGKGDEDQVPATGLAAAFKFLGDAVSKRPEILDHGTRLLGALADRLTKPSSSTTVIRQVAPGTSIAPTLSGVSPAQTSTSPLVTAPGVSSNASPEPNQAASGEEGIPQSVIDELLRAILSGYAQGYEGSAVAESLGMLYPNVVPMLRQYMNIPDFMVMAWLRQQKVLESIVNDTDFPSFVHDFKQAILHPEIFAEPPAEPLANNGTAAVAPSDGVKAN